MGASRTVALCCLCVVLHAISIIPGRLDKSTTPLTYLAVLAFPDEVGLAAATLLLVHFLSLVSVTGGARLKAASILHDG